MNEQERETDFLRHCLRYDDSPERHSLEEKITELQRDERCLRRALWLMFVLAGLATAGIGYCAVFLADLQHVSGFIMQTIPKVFCALGLGSVICLLAFAWIGIMNRKELDHHRDQCRHLATKLLESRLGQPRAVEGPAGEISSEKSGA